VAAFSISRAKHDKQKRGEINEHANHRHRQPEGRRRQDDHLRQLLGIGLAQAGRKVLLVDADP